MPCTIAMTYAEIQAEALAIAKDKGACFDQYRRAAKAEELAQLAQVLKDNFHWCCVHELLTPHTIVRWGLRPYGITSNEDVSSGYCLASGSATVRASGSAYVHAPYGAIECKLSDQAILRHGGTITSSNGQTITF